MMCTTLWGMWVWVYILHHNAGLPFGLEQFNRDHVGMSVSIQFAMQGLHAVLISSIRSM